VSDDPNDGTVQVSPRIVRYALDNGLDIGQPIPDCVPGQKLSGFTINVLPSTVNMTRAWGPGYPSTRCFQGQCFGFGSYGACIGVVQDGLFFGCAPAAGQFLELELYFAPSLVRVVTSQ